MTHANCSPCIPRRFVGPEATEIFVHCQPDRLTNDVGRQTVSAYEKLRDVLRSEGGGLEHVVQETVFFRNIRKDFAAFQRGRSRTLDHHFHPASTFIEQPPLSEGTPLEISAFAVIPHGWRESKSWDVWSTVSCLCNDCSHIGGHALQLGRQRHLRTGNIYGPPQGPFAETYGMFCAAEQLLRQDGMTFADVVRTWIHLRHIDRDYAEFNRARRQFFHERGIELRPASTGICGAPFPQEHNLSMSLHAIKSPGPLRLGVMTTPTLNEAWMYGSDFSRGLKVVEANKIALYVSGTASVDEAGRTAHVGNFEGQVQRMLVNVLTLLQEQNASFGDLVSAITYVKDPANAARLRAILEEHGLSALPNAVVEASVCRPDLLCEMEAIAALPRPLADAESDPS